MQLEIIAGGQGPERAGAILSGKHVHEACATLGINAKLHDAATLNFKELKKNNSIFLTTHGWYGEDGKLQGTLDTLKISYSGSGVAASAAAYFKPFANAIAKSAGLNVPNHQTIDLTSNEVFDFHRTIEDLGPEIFIKPASNGCSQGSVIINCESDIIGWSASASTEEHPVFLAAEFIKGKDISVGIVEIENKPTILPLLETRHEDLFYSFEVKSGKKKREYLCPADIPYAAEKLIQEHALAIYKALGCKGFSRIDFILADRKPWFLEVNTIPGLSREGNLAQMGYAHGWSYVDLISHLIATIDHSVKYRP